MDKLTGITGVQFFGQMTASISHEIKNRIAVINEQAGLLQDFVLLAEQGRPIDLERLGRLAATVKNQVAKTDTIIQTMNRFSHYVDRIVLPVDGNDILLTTASMVERLVQMRGFGLEVRPAGGSATVTTSPFILMNLLWLCLQAAMKGAEAGSTIGMECRAGTTGVEIHVSGSGDAQKCFGAMDIEEVDALKAILGASLETEEKTFGFVIALPQAIGKSTDPPQAS